MKPYPPFRTAAFVCAISCLHAATVSARDAVLVPKGDLNELHSKIEEIREERRRTGDVSHVRILIEDGTFRFERPLVLEASDSNLTLEAKPGTRPVFDGGRLIKNWTLNAQGHWTTQVDPEWRFETLWVNGKRATRARTPNKGFVQATWQPTSPIENIPLAGDVQKTVVGVKADHTQPLGFLSQEEQREMQVLVYHSWDVSRMRVAGVHPSNGKIQFTGTSRDFFSSHAPPRLRFENYLAAMDEPGEWFLEKNGLLHYIPQPGETPAETAVTAPVATQWLVFKGQPEQGKLVENVRLSGLTFQHQHWLTPKEGIHAGQIESRLPQPAVEANGTRGAIFENCTFQRTSTHAIWLRNGCAEGRVTRCLFQDLGAGGVYIGDPGVSADGPKHTHHVSVENSIFRGGGRTFPAGIGVSIFHASDCTVRHCDIGDFYYSAISIGWTWGYKPTVAGRNRVEFCHLHHLGWAELSDLGAVYTLGQQLGTVVNNNHIHSIGCASYGGWGMYNDEGSTGVLWENNLVHDTQTAGYHQHYGRGNIVRNNILAWGAEEHVRRSKPEDMLAFAFERNIVLMGEGRLLMQTDKNWHDGRVFMADNVYWHPKGPPADFAGKTWSEWQAAGNDVRSLLADPLFANPKHGDWTLAKDSPALKLGFQPFDWKLAGVEGDADWKALAAAPLPKMVYGTKALPEPVKVMEDFESHRPGERVAPGKKGSQKPELFIAAGIPEASGHCLEIRDGPELAHGYDPHFFYDPVHTTGTTHVSFDLRMEPDHQFIHEWRDGSNPYRTSVYLSINKGTLTAGGRKLDSFPPLTWIHFELEAPVGKDADGSWTLRYTPAGGKTVTVEKLPPQKSGGTELRWVGFISPGTAPTKAWLDNIAIDSK
jgi:hypothetical protein